MAERSAGGFEVKDARSAPKRTASGGDPCGVVLKFPSRIIASKQSMTDRRRARRAARGERERGNMHVSCLDGAPCQGFR